VTTDSEDSRRLFQERLALTYKVGFALCASFVLGVIVIRGLLAGRLGSELAAPSRWFLIGATLVMGLIWLAVARWRLGLRALEAIDAGGILFLGLLLNLNAGLFELRSVAVFNLVLTTGIPLTLRAILIPSTAGRTLWLGLAGCAVALGIFLLSALHPAWPVRQAGASDWALSFQLISLLLWLGAFVTTATVASRVIYGLRREVRAARKFGQYVLGDKLGEGGMGVVYLATHAMLRRDAALKLLLPARMDPGSLARFEREVVATARLHHPNTVAVFDYGRTPDGLFYYAMEYLDGLTVDQLVAQGGPLPPGRVVWLLAQVCASLDEAHAMGLVHRDVKPQNIMVVGHTAAFDLVKVLDFGLVKAFDAGRSDAEDAPSGTPLYMAPEAIATPSQVDARTDLYAVAAVGYFMLTGQAVFEGRSIAEVCAAHLSALPRPPSERLGRAVPGDLERLVLRGLAKSPADRPGSAAAFRTALLGCDVPAWTQDDARLWWTTCGARALRPTLPKIDLLHAPTVSVVPERRGASS